MEKPNSYALDEEEEAIIQNLAREKDPIYDLTYYQYQGFWVPSIAIIRAVLSLQKHFLARDDDILLASCPKSGTTWLKALSFSIVNRQRFSDLSDSPLTASNPHDFVPNLEFDVYADKQSIVDHVEALPRPRLLCTHVAYESLPVSVKSSKCKIVYVWRNPMDQAVSLWHFLRALGLKPNDTSLQREEGEDEFFESFCRGVHLFGPFWEHVLGFWKASSDNPEKILLIRYEDLKKDTQCEVKKLAGFLGFPFSEEEEREGAVKKICEACSIEKMKSYKGNREGVRLSGAPNTSYFRKGEVGDWMNQISPILAQKMQRIIQQKFEHSDLKV